MQGEFQSEDGRWGRVSILLQDIQDREDTLELNGWDRSFYEGDKLHLGNDSLCARSGESDGDAAALQR